MPTVNIGESFPLLPPLLYWVAHSVCKIDGTTLQQSLDKTVSLAHMNHGSIDSVGEFIPEIL